MGTTIHHCGKVGSGIRTKLVNNYLAIVSCQLNAEALALSQRFGLDLPKTLEVLYGTTATNGQLRVNWPNKVLVGDTTPGFTIDLAHKDLSIILAASQTAKVPAPVGAAAREIFTAARARRTSRASSTSSAISPVWRSHACQRAGSPPHSCDVRYEEAALPRRPCRQLASAA
jgi:3-hydroxyisobutyrate dehydrogenase and related beta-hydroxyacid dehydrogenases